MDAHAFTQLKERASRIGDEIKRHKHELSSLAIQPVTNAEAMIAKRAEIKTLEDELKELKKQILTEELELLG